MTKAIEKTNVMRILDQAKIKYSAYSYSPSLTEGTAVANFLKEDPSCVYKTLVTISNTGEHFVFVIPVACTLHLKKAATVAKVKAIEMIKQKELLPLTGYVHGGCSPIGMKKAFTTFFDESIFLSSSIFISAGKVGFQVSLSPDTLLNFLQSKTADLTV